MEHPDEEDAQVEQYSRIPEEKFEVLVFQLGDENYGIDIHQIAEIIRFVEPTEIPNTAAYLDGIISLRGRMVPVINGRKRLGMNCGSLIGNPGSLCCKMIPNYKEFLWIPLHKWLNCQNKYRTASSCCGWRGCRIY